MAKYLLQQIILIADSTTASLTTSSIVLPPYFLAIRAFVLLPVHYCHTSHTGYNHLPLHAAREDAICCPPDRLSAGAQPSGAS